MVPKSPAAIEYFKLNGNHPPTQITDHIENKVNKDEVIADEVVDFTVNNTLEEGVKEHGEDDEDQGEEYSEASEDNLEEFIIIDEYKMEEEDEQQLNKSTLAGINGKCEKRKPSVGIYRSSVKPTTNTNELKV